MTEKDRLFYAASAMLDALQGVGTDETTSSFDLMDAVWDEFEAVVKEMRAKKEADDEL
jgi:hypothetical protein